MREQLEAAAALAKGITSAFQRAPASEWRAHIEATVNRLARKV
jgi:hypothetical protein